MRTTSKNTLLLVFGLLALITLACQLSQPSAAQQQIDQAKTMVAGLTTETQQQIQDGDYYVAAVNLQTLLGNPGVDELIQQVAPYTPGGLVMEGMPPFYVAFANRDAVALPNWPQNGLALLAIKSDGSQGVVREEYNSVSSFRLDFTTGAWTPYDVYDPNPSPDLQWALHLDLWDGAYAYNVETGETIQLCSPYNNNYRWSRDSKRLVATDGNDQSVYIIDLPSGNCQQITLPGLDWDTDVLPSPDNEHLIIILPGSYGAQEYAQLLVSNLDGTGIKKIADLPFAGRDISGVTLVAPDGSAIYIDGYVISTRTGRYARTLWKAVVWLDYAPPTAVARQVTLTVTPENGPRGTRFAFRLEGAPAGQEIAWFVSTSAQWVESLGYEIAEIGPDGILTDAEGQFGWDTGLSTNAGTYYVSVMIDKQIIASAAFEVTEP